jgi:glyoxylase-like metal-dependent hydrolase (beta-lactamase superfamily II)
MPVTLAGYTVEPLVDVEGAFFPLAVVFPDVPLESWEPYRDRFPDTFFREDMLYTRVTCYLIRGHGRTVLVDAGIGAGPNPLFGHQRGRLLQELAQRGLAPGDIDTVILTHLHPDHIGWAAQSGQPTFPRARYLVHTRELETFQREDVRAAMHQIAPGYLDRCLDPLQQAGVLATVDDDTEIAPGLLLTISPGHTPGMMRVVLRGTPSSLWLVADTFTHPAQVTEPTWCSAFDMDRSQAIATRFEVLGRAHEEDALVMASHFPTIPGRIRQENGSFRWEPISD